MGKTPAKIQRRVCTECGMITTPGGLGNHQKSSGHTAWMTLEEYNLSKSAEEAAFEERVNAAVEARLQEEVESAIRIHRGKGVSADHLMAMNELRDQLNATLRKEAITQRIIFALIFIIICLLIFLAV